MQKFYLKSLIFFICLVLLQAVVLAQSILIDSLEVRLKHAGDDTTKVILLNDMVSKYQHVNPERALELAGISAALAKRLNYDFGLGVAYRLTGVLYADKSNLDTASVYYNKSFELFRNKNDDRSRRYRGMLQHNFGVIYHYKGLYDSAVICYQEAVRIYKELKDDNLLFLTYNNLSTLYAQILDNRNALQYAQECLIISNRLKDPYKISVSSLAMASAKSELKDYNGIDSFINNVITISQKSGNHYMLGMGYKFLGKYQMESQNDNKGSISSFKAALDNMIQAQNDYEIAAANQNLAFSYFINGDNNEAVHYFKIAIEQSQKSGIPQIEQYALKNLAELEEKRKNFHDAYYYLQNYMSVNDSVIAKTHAENIQALEAKYQSEIKDAKISQLDNEKQIQALSLKQKSTLNYILIGSLVVLLAVGFLGYRNFRHRQLLAKQQEKLQQQHISELEKDKQLVAVDSMLKGQEDERTRLAKDLHDGLGGMLTGVKFSLMNMKSNLIVRHENVAVFERSLDMLDTSIHELRRVAHNMMPEALVKFGLDEALKDYCNNLNNANALHIQYQSFGMEQRLESTSEIIIYRIIQELLNNIFKHAKATEVLIQLFREENRLSITVEDNGEGFDINDLDKNKGAGWANIRNRVDYLKGKLDIHSDAVKGTSVNIECPCLL